MDTYQRYEALLKIQVQLQEWASRQPSWHWKLHGSREINESLQDIKKLIAISAQELLVEESQKMNMYFESPQALDSNNLE